MKKLLSALLVAMMVIGLMPVSSALTYGDVEIPEEMYFEISSPSHGFTGSKDKNDVDGDKNTTESHPWRGLSNPHNADIDVTVASVSDPWRFAGNNDCASLALNDTGFSWSFYLDNEGDTNPDGTPGLQPFDPESEVMARVAMFELQCNESGMFVPALIYHSAPSGAVFDIYLVKKQAGDTDKTGDALSDYVKGLDRRYCIGTVDTYGNNVTGVETRLSPVEITAGRYYFILVPTGVNKDIVYSIGSGKYAGVPYPYSNFKGIKFTPSLRADNVELVYNTVTTSVLKSGVDITGKLDTDTTGMVGLPHTTKSTERGTIAGFWKSGSAYTIYNHEVNCLPHIDGTVSDPWTVVTQYGKNNFFIDKNYTQMNSLNGDDTDKVNTGDYFIPGKWPYILFKVKVPYAGKYNFSVKGYKKLGGANCHFYILPAEKTISGHADFETDEYFVGTHSFWEEGVTSEVAETDYSEVGAVNIPLSGEYYVVCELRTGLGDPILSSTWVNLDKDATTGNSGKPIEEGAQIDGKEYNFNRHLYEVRLSSFKLTAAGITDEEKEIADAKEEAKNLDAENAVKEAPVSKNAEVRIYSSLGTLLGTENYTAGGDAVTLNASDYTTEGYEFLYWAKGIGLKRRAVSDTAEYTFVPEKGLTSLTAVFREKDSEYVTVEFYNMNRALVKRYDTTYKQGDEISMEALPYMTGLGQANGWILAAGNKFYGIDDVAEAAGKSMIFVADYDEPTANISVSVTGGYFDGGATTSTVAYGDEVTVNAKKRSTDGTKYFAYWKRGGEIVSFARTYTFNAYKTETIEAVYVDYETVAQTVRKIVVDTITTGTENALMAEFLLDGEKVIERGFVFGSGTPTVNDCSYKSAMTTGKKQFSIIDDSELNCRAYAILEDGVVYSE